MTFYDSIGKSLAGGLTDTLCIDFGFFWNLSRYLLFNQSFSLFFTFEFCCEHLVETESFEGFAKRSASGCCTLSP
jgi:hypothetical protein